MTLKGATSELTSSLSMRRRLQSWLCSCHSPADDAPVPREDPCGPGSPPLLPPVHSAPNLSRIPLSASGQPPRASKLRAAGLPRTRRSLSAPSIRRSFSMPSFGYTLAAFAAAASERYRPSSSSADLLSQHYGRLSYVYSASVAVCFAILAMVFVAFVDQGIRWLIFVFFCAAAVFVIVVLPPPDARARGWAALNRPELFVMIPICVQNRLAPLPPPSPGFVPELIALAFVVTVGHIVLGMRNFPLLDRVLTGIMLFTSNLDAPLFGIGWREHAIFFGAHLVGFLLGHFINAQQKQLYEVIDALELQRRADTRLYHVIKGHCGVAATFLAMVHDKEAERIPAEGMPPTGGAFGSLTLLSDISSMIKDAEEWCHLREVVVQLEAGVYKMQLCCIQLHELLASLVGDLGTFDAPVCVVADPNLVRLVVSEGVSNASTYGRRNTPIHVKAELVVPPGVVTPLSHHLHISIANLNKPDVAPMSHAECKRAFSRRARAMRAVHNLTATDGYGLVVVRRAMDVVNGATWLCAEDAITTLHAKLPAAPSSAAPSSLMEGKGEDETKL